MTVSAPSRRTLVLASTGHWSLCAWTRGGATLVDTFRQRTDPNDPPEWPSDATMAKPWQKGYGARELVMVFARDGQTAWRLYSREIHGKREVQAH